MRQLNAKSKMINFDNRRKVLQYTCFHFWNFIKIFVEIPKFTVDVSAKTKNWFIHSTATCIQFYEKTGSRLIVFLVD